MAKIKVDERKVDNEVSRLDRIFVEIDTNMKELIAPFIRNYAFITVYIEILRGEIHKNGMTEKYDNGGGQIGIKESVWVKLHKDYTKLQKDCIKTLAGYVPKSKRKETMLAAMRESND